MSSSVIVARTRMCRTTVAIILGGKWCGDWWHRPQFVENRFSPSASIASLSRTGGSAGVFAAAEAELVGALAVETVPAAELVAGVGLAAGAGAEAAGAGTPAGTAARVAAC